MNAQSLLASAAINMGLALVVLSLFSIFKKQPSNAIVYFPRLISKQSHVPFEHGFTLRRFLPSIAWIKRAFQVSEEEILQKCGFDALVVLRLFKFGINFFWVCSVVGLVILLPVNYTGNLGSSRATLSHSMDSFTISNITRGSNRLWVHLSCLYFISLYVLYLLYKEYDEILRRRIQYLYNFRHRPEQFTVLVREIPFCSVHKDHGCCVDHFFSKHHPYTYRSCQIVYDGGDIEELLCKAESTVTEIENLRQRTLIRKQTRGPNFFDCFGEKFDHIRMHEQKLRELCQKIRYLQGENMLKKKELPVAFVSFKSRWGANLAAETQQYVNPLMWITELAPEPRDVLWHNLAIPYRHLAFHKIGVYIAASVLTIFFAIPVTAVQGIAQLENIKKWFPPARAVQLIPGLNSVLTGYLPSVILNNFIYIVPFAMLYLSSLEGCVSRSRKEIKACSMVFYFLVGNVFFLSLLSGSLLEQIGQSFTRPRSFPSHLASAVSTQADFFITYILTDGLSGFSLEVLQPGLIIWRYMTAHSACQGTKAQPYLYSVPYYRFIPVVSLAILIGMVYAVIAPLLLPFLIVYFFLGYVVYLNQITMIGLFGMKSKPAASISTIPLLLLTILFNEYCKARFLPTFYNYSVQSTMEMDERDTKEGMMEANREHAIYAYRQPCLRSVIIDSPETSTIQPLVSSS